MALAHFMSFSNALSSVILSRLWQSILLGTTIAGLTYLLVRLLRLRTGFTVETGLWLIVLIKFLIPIGPSWTLSLGSLYEQILQFTPVHNISPTDSIVYDIENPFPADVNPHDDTPSSTLTMYEYSPAIKDATLPRWHWRTFLGMAYLVALAMRNAGPFMDEFPYADRNQSGNLDIIEANDVIRAITLIAYADRRACATSEYVLPLEFCHAALDAQEWLLANASSEPKPSELDPIWSVLCRIKGHPNGYAARMFDHGGPDELKGPRKFDLDSFSQFHELEGNIAAIKERLATTSDQDQIATLTRMLTKLETLLSKLQQ